MSNDLQLFDVPAVHVDLSERLSADARRTARRAARLAAGQHPLMAGPVTTIEGATCGNCEHHFVWTRNRTWHKCSINATHGAATDIRVSWPGCNLWQAPLDGGAA